MARNSRTLKKESHWEQRMSPKVMYRSEIKMYMYLLYIYLHRGMSTEVNNSITQLNKYKIVYMFSSEDIHSAKSKSISIFYVIIFLELVLTFKCLIKVTASRLVSASLISITGVVSEFTHCVYRSFPCSGGATSLRAKSPICGAECNSVKVSSLINNTQNSLSLSFNKISPYCMFVSLDI